MALLILGAGATRGASFSGHDRVVLPPLDSDFFTQLQRIDDPKHKRLVDTVLRHVVQLFGTNFNLTLEDVFTTLEQSIRVVNATGNHGRYVREYLLRARDDLVQSIAAVLEAALADLAPGRQQLPIRCDHHYAIVRQLKPSDRIISFNYDCTIDTALANEGGGIWNPRYGYGFNLGPRGSRLKGEDYWAPLGHATDRLKTLLLLKLHGSLHFQISAAKPRGYSVRLKQRPYTKQRGDLRFTIVPPEWNKSFEKGPFGDLWRHAVQAIRRNKTVVFIGYSFPITDPHTASMFRINAANSLSSLVVVNPDRNARRRTREILKANITPDTRVMSFDTIGEFARAPRSLWDR